MDVQIEPMAYDTGSLAMHPVQHQLKVTSRMADSTLA